MAAKHQLLLLAREGSKPIALADPLDTDGIDALGYIVKMMSRASVATPEGHHHRDRPLLR